MQIKSIKKVSVLKGKRVLVRCDFDVPLDKQQTCLPAGRQQTTVDKELLIVESHKLSVADDSRLLAAVPTIQYLLAKGAQVALIGHLGRPAGKVVPEMSLLPVKERLEELLNQNTKNSQQKTKISFYDIDRYISYKILKRVQNDKSKLIMLENLRFSDREEKNCQRFAKNLAKLGNLYVNEAFAVSHRSAASVDAIKKYLPSYAGLNLEKEIENLSYVLQSPKKPLVVIIGGAKIETKVPVIKQFLKSADHILVGGAVANDFIKALGYEVGESLVDSDYIEEAKELFKKSKIQNPNVKLMPKIIIPIDVVIRNKKQEARSKTIENILNDDKILDIGAKTVKIFSDIIKKAGTVVWNGPMGYFEDKKFAVGTMAVAKSILNSKARIVVGGGETSEALKMSNVKCQMSNGLIFVSTGGGAMLDFLGGNELPGLKKIYSN